MAGYPQPPGYGYGAPPSQPYGSAPPGQPYGSSSSPYGTPPAGQPYGSSGPYGAPPTAGQPFGASGSYGAPPAAGQPYAPVASPYGAPSAPYAPAGPQPGQKPPKNKPESDHHGGGGGGYYGTASAPPQQPYGGGSSPFAMLAPSAFPPGTDPNIVAYFQMADQDGSGLIDDKELQKILSAYNQNGFSLRTVHLLMYLFTNSNSRKIGPKEFISVYYSLQSWRAIFDRFDRDRSGKIDSSELREALLSLGFAVPPVILDLLISKFDKTGGKNNAIEYDNFIEYVIGLTEKFKEKDTSYSGSATFTYETFMLTVLPFLIA
ncbi:EF-hand domain [Macleaya cordata]|uniref:EF-hand domain n=1 Tax=Macleaya cordata TaxID=56857 RepID=A0A200QE47_MACCD|nr:EF-hand domain [Macleaya cordata]